MSENNFLSFYQQLLTMVNPDDENSVTLAKIALQSVITLAKSSNKVNPIVLRMMYMAEIRFESLARCKNDYCGRPGDYKNNEIKRQRLAHILSPGC